MALPRTLLLGGARSGKSTRAELLLADRPDVLYVATSGTRDGDADWARRVDLHRARRPAYWRTAETCALEAVEARCAALAAAWAATPREAVAVSNEVGMGVVPATAAGRRFRDTLGRLNRAVADASQQVLL